MMTLQLLFTCEGCGLVCTVAADPLPTRAEAIAEASDKGWEILQVHGVPLCFCPDCRRRPHTGPAIQIPLGEARA